MFFFKEPQRATGKFKEDFENLCLSKNVKYVPEIISRGKRPGSAIQRDYINALLNPTSVPSAKLEKNDKKGGSTAKSNKQASSLIEIESSIENNPEIMNDLPPKSFITKEPLEFFKPKIHVEMDNPDKLDTVTEIHIKGWKVEKAIFEIFSVCLPAVDQLNTLK